MKRLALTALLLGTFLVIPASAQLQYFGYVNGADEDASIEATKSYTNWSWLVYTPERSTPWMAQRLDALARSDMKAILELSYLLWDPASNYTSLYPDYLQRWNAFKTALHPYLASGQVIAVQVRDEPFNNRVSIYDWETAAQMIRRDYPNIKILLVEHLSAVAALDPYTHFNLYKGVIHTVDWIGVFGYAIDPVTNETFRSALDIMKWTYPNRKFVYVADGWWGQEHINNFGPGTNISYMGEIMRRWYDVARADASAVLLGVFIWGPLSEGITSKDFPCDVLSVHVEVGRAITGRVRPRTSLPIGRLESISNGTGALTGWACDPDGAICEFPPIALKVNGGNYPGAYYPPDSRFANSQCPSGVAYRFKQNIVAGGSGYPITAYASDLDGGGTTLLPSNCPENPACIFYTTKYAPKGYMEDISSTGFVTGWVCDQDAPQVSSLALLTTGDGTTIGYYIANQSSEQAVADQCGGGYQHRFSAQLPSWARGKAIYAYAVDLVAGKVQLSWLCYKHSYCIWW